MKKHIENFLVCGIMVRTNNKIEMSEEGKIPKLWEDFHKQDIANHIIHKVSDDIVAVYSNYDHLGNYDYLIGVEVKSMYQKENLKTIKVYGGDYFHLRTPQGDTQTVVPELWKNISAMTEFDIDKKRSFVTDFEIYGKDARDPQNSIVDVYVGISFAYDVPEEPFYESQMHG